MKKTALASLLLIALSLATSVSSPVSADSNIDRISDKAVAFVLDRFNASMGLCSEVVEGTPNSIGFSGSVYWIYSDNVLAYALLRQYNLTIANILRESLLNYASAYHLDTDANGFPIDHKHEPILSAYVTEDFNGSVGDSFPSNFVPRNAVLRDLNVSSSFKVCTEIDNGANFTDYSGYVDWLAWIGLSYLNIYVASQHTNTTALSLAIQYYNDLMKFWQGNGFHDKRYDYLHYYETFKLGLAIYFRKALDGAGASIIKPDAENTMERIIEICQLDNGGVCVNYDDSLDVWGNPNVETTALVGLAGIVKIPESCGVSSYQDRINILTTQVNNLTRQIADLNSQISNLETQNKLQTFIIPLATGAIAIAAVIVATYLFYSKRKSAHASRARRRKESG